MSTTVFLPGNTWLCCGIPVPFYKCTDWIFWQYMACTFSLALCYDTVSNCYVVLGEDVGFHWYSYTCLGDNHTLVHYLGDNEKLRAFPQGNSKSDGGIPEPVCLC